MLIRPRDAQDIYLVNGSQFSINITSFTINTVILNREEKSL